MDARLRKVYEQVVTRVGGRIEQKLIEAGLVDVQGDPQSPLTAAGVQRMVSTVGSGICSAF